MDVAIAYKGINKYMRKIKLEYDKEQVLAETEIADMEKILEGESIYIQEEEAQEYSERVIVSFTFEDGMVPRKDGIVASSAQFIMAMGENERVFTTKNQNGFNVFLATSRDDLHPLGYIVMNTTEFIQENPDGLYDIWCELLDEVKS
jgi:hypothetical protein